MSQPKTGLFVKLIPFDPEIHAEHAMNWFYDVRYQAFFREFDDIAFNLDAFKAMEKAMEKRGVHLFTLVDKSNHQPMGLMTYECIKKKARVYRWGIMMAEEHQHKTVAIEAIILLSYFLVENFGATKLAVEFLESNKHIQRITEKGGFTREGVLLNEAVIDGKLENEVRYSISKEKLYEVSGSFYESLDELEENKHR